MNELFFLLQLCLAMPLLLLAVFLGRTYLIGWVAFQGVLANFFVLKQIELFHCHVTASDVYVISGMLGLNLLRERYGMAAAKESLFTSLLFLVGFLFFSHLHLLFVPAAWDFTQGAYEILLSPSWRIIGASIGVFFVVSLFDIWFFSRLKKRWEGGLFALRLFLTLLVAESLDTVLFSFAGLYGIVDSVGSIIGVSLLIKGIAIVCQVPFGLLAKRIDGAVSV